MFFRERLVQAPASAGDDEDPPSVTTNWAYDAHVARIAKSTIVAGRGGTTSAASFLAGEGTGITTLRLPAKGGGITSTQVMAVDAFVQIH